MNQSVSDLAGEQEQENTEQTAKKKPGPKPGAKRGARSQDSRDAKRRKRTPLGTPRSKLKTRHNQGFVRRWVNDTGGRIEAAQEGGYDFVRDESVGEGEDRNSDLGSATSQIVGKKEDGSPLRAYLMEIPQDWYEEDQRVKQQAVDRKDEAIKQGKLESQADDGRYIPREGIKMNRDGG